MKILFQGQSNTLAYFARYARTRRKNILQTIQIDQLVSEIKTVFLLKIGAKTSLKNIISETI